VTVSRRPLSDRDLELLSAYVDGALSDREKALLEQRLATDLALRAELATLRETVALLRDLPPLKAPRNFTLDPSVFGRSIPWWRRLVMLENLLQLSGAIGAAASVALVIVALILGDGRAEREKTVAEVGMAQQASSDPTTTLEVLNTAIAYSGEDLIQTTIVAQSLYMTAQALPTQTRRDATATSETVTDSEEAEMPSLALSDDSSGFAEDSALSGSTDIVGQPAPEAYAPQQGVSESDSAVDEPPASSALSPTVGSVAEANEGAAALRDTQDSGTAQSEAQAGAQEMAQTPQPGGVILNSPPPLSPTAASAQAVAEAPDEHDETANKTPADNNQTTESRDMRWLTAVGALSLLISLIVFLVGYRKARQA
jgi:hypothetical protein